MTDSHVFLITGAIGKAIARKLATIPGSEIVLICRNSAKAEQTIQELIHSSGNQNVRFEVCDLSRHSEICKLAEQLDRSAACFNQQCGLRTAYPSAIP